jgi:hypothetical protein
MASGQISSLGMAALVLGLAWMGSGCGSGDHAPQTTAVSGPAASGAPATDRYKVVADATPFYRLGPQQAGGPDLSLKKGDEVKMVQRAYGYSRVTTSGGLVGYVGTEDISQLSAQDLAAENAAAAQAAAQKRSSAIVGEYTLPPGATSLDQLPVSDPAPTPKPTPNPYFRY